MSAPSLDRTNRLYQTITTRPVAVLCVVAAFVVFGYVSLKDLPTTLMPNLNYPNLTIRTHYAAAAPIDIEEKVSKQIEERIGNVPGLRQRSSISRAEQSDVLLEFAWGTDMLQATADVRDRLDRARLDDGVERPQILRYDPGQDPALRLMLFATRDDISLLELRSFADDVLKPELSKIDGVAAVRVSGGAERQVKISLRERDLNQHRLTAQQVFERIRAARVDISAGLISLAGQDVILRVVSTYDRTKVLEDLEIVGGADRARVLLKDVADIRIEEKERKTVTRFAGAETGFEAREGVLLEILKEGDANIVQTAKRVWIALYGESRYEAIRRQRGEDASRPPMTGKPGEKGPDVSKGGSGRGGGARAGRGGGAGAATRAFAPGQGGFAMGPRALADQLPDGFGVRVLSDQSYFIEDAVNDVTSSAVLGAMLAVLVLFLFLRNLKSTFLIAVSIPLSVVATFIPMRLQGVTLNLMSLGGLALGVGMLVDNSIVVLESIARCRQEGDNPLQAAVRGISEVGAAVFASTMTTVAVFFPIVFVTGIAGQIFRDQALAVCYSLLASLIVAMFVVPALAGLSFAGLSQAQAFAATRATAGYLRPQPGLPLWRKLLFFAGRLIQLPFVLAALLVVGLLDTLTLVLRYVLHGLWAAVSLVARPVGRLFDLGWRAVEEFYPLVLRLFLPQPLLVLAVAAALGVAALLVSRTLDTELLPDFQQGEYYADMAAPEGTKIELTDAEAQSLIQRAFAGEDFKSTVARISSETGGEGQAGDRRELGSHRTRLVVTLKPGQDPRLVTGQTQDNLRREVEDSPMFQGSGEFSAPQLFSLSTGIELEVRGSNYDRLGRVAEALAREMRRLTRDDGQPLLLEVQSSLRPGRPQIALSYDRELLERYGLTADQVTRAVRIKVGGEVSSSFTSSGEDIDVFVELGSADKASVDRVLEIEVASGVRLKDVLPAGVRPAPEEGPSEIRRVGNERAIILHAEPNGVALGFAKKRIEALVQGGSVDLDDSAVRFAGQASEMEESVTSLLLALALAIFLVYVVMAVQFENLIDPLIIMFSVPLAGVGVVAALIAFSMPVSVMVLLGVIVLAGIVVNNAIVLVDYANLLQSRGMSARDAALAACKIRLRPIAITTLTTLLGLLPMSGWLDPFMPAATGLAAAIDAGLRAAVEGAGLSLTSPSDWPLIGGNTFSLARGLRFLIGGGEGAEVRKPLAITVIVGLTSSTALTLLVIPTLWAWINKRRDKPVTQP